MTDTATDTVTNISTVTDTTPSGRLLYSPVEAARVLGIGRSTLYVLLADGTIPSVRIGTSRRIRAADLATWTARLQPAGPTRPAPRLSPTRSAPDASGPALDTPSAREDPA